MSGMPIAIDSLPPGADYRRIVYGRVSAVITPSVTVNGGASAGSRRIDDGSPTLAETLTEQVRWSFDSADAVRQVWLRLQVEPRIVTAISGTGAAVATAHEARCALAVANPGDDTVAATLLLAGRGDRWIPPNEWVALPADVPITDVYAICKLSDVSSPLQGGARLICVGVSYA